MNPRNSTDTSSRIDGNSASGTEYAVAGLHYFRSVGVLQRERNWLLGVELGDPSQLSLEFHGLKKIVATAIFYHNPFRIQAFNQQQDTINRRLGID
jgi:hypothetical protein